jgi:UPF0755 protein
MKKIFLSILTILVIAAVIAAWLFFGSATAFNTPKAYFEIATGSNYNNVLQQLKKQNILSSATAFDFVAKRLNYPGKVKAGRYEIKRGTNVVKLVRMLANGQQSPVNLVITRLRTKEDFAELTGKKFEFDSLAMIKFLNNNDSLKKYALDTNTIMSMILPNTYTYYWNTTPSKIFVKLKNAYDEFWTAERKQQAAAKGLTPQTAYTLASIVEEETNKQDEKGNVASVYLNRLNTGMRLGADPTVKFALKDFGLKRIYNKHLQVQSPYNTYRVNGLPPGPICTPSTKTIDAVLQSPQTNYLYFVAKSDFSGYHSFASSYEDHLKYAKEYQLALDKLLEQKRSKEEVEAQ